MPNYKNMEYEVSEGPGGWKGISLAGEHTKTGVAATNAVAIMQVLKAIDSIVKQKQKEATAIDVAKWFASTGLQPPK